MKKPVWMGQTGILERETGFEPATTCLEGRDSTTELLPHFSRGERTRTSDLSVPNAARYLLRHTPIVRFRD